MARATELRTFSRTCDTPRVVTATRLGERWQVPLAAGQLRILTQVYRLLRLRGLEDGPYDAYVA